MDLETKYIITISSLLSIHLLIIKPNSHLQKNSEILTDGNLSFTSIMLSLKNNFANVSQAGCSSYFYLMPVNILWAEHQYLYSLYKHGKYFRDRPMQRCFDNKSEIFATLYLGSPGEDLVRTNEPVGTTAFLMSIWKKIFII